jgi:hypothetical protein
VAEVALGGHREERGRGKWRQEREEMGARVWGLEDRIRRERGAGACAVDGEGRTTGSHAMCVLLPSLSSEEGKEETELVSKGYSGQAERKKERRESGLRLGLAGRKEKKEGKAWKDRGWGFSFKIHVPLFILKTSLKQGLNSKATLNLNRDVGDRKQNN